MTNKELLNTLKSITGVEWTPEMLADLEKKIKAPADEYEYNEAGDALSILTNAAWHYVMGHCYEEEK